MNNYHASTPIYCYAICHDYTERWHMSICDNTGEYGWTDELYLADVYFQSDMDAGDCPELPRNTHWVALTWEDYCRLMEDCPPFPQWVEAINNRTAS